MANAGRVMQVLELGIVVHSVVIGLSMGTSNNQCIIKPLVAALCFHQLLEGMGLGGCIFQVILYILTNYIMNLFRYRCVLNFLFDLSTTSFKKHAKGFSGPKKNSITKMFHL